MTTENKPENKPDNDGSLTITTEAINFIAEKIKEIKQENAHLAARVETLEKQAGAALEGAGDQIKKAAKGSKSWFEELFD